MLPQAVLKLTLVDDLSVMTFNVRHCRGLDDVVDVARVGAIVRESAVRLVALQELDRGMERSNRTDQPGELSEATGMHVAFHPTIGSEAGDYGIALACDEELEVRGVDLPRRRNEEPRALLVARWGEIHVLATHLSRARAARRSQISFIAGLVSELGGPVALLGDLNEGPAGLGPLRGAGLDGPRLLTRPALGLRSGRGRPGRQSDYILAGGGIAAVAGRTIATTASDHLPLVAILRTD